MSKVTSEDWPDPTSWAKALFDQLEHIGGEYLSLPWQAADDPEAFDGLNLKQARAAETLVVVCHALRDLPLFEKSKGVAVLHDIAGALRDVVVGGAPRLFTAVSTGKRGADGIHRNYVKVQVLCSLRFLMEAHSIAEGAAIKTVSGIFAAAGATGRKGSPLSATTVQDWQNTINALASNPDHLRIHREVEALLGNFKENPDWPGTYADAVKWIETVAAHPLVRSKYG